MKRTLSLILCLVMVLGLLPAVALAEGEETTIDVNTTGENTSELPFKLYDELEGGTEITANSDGVYYVEYPVGQDKTVYLRIVGDNADTFSEAPFHSGISVDGNEVTFVSSELLNNGKIMAVTHHSNDSSTMSQRDTIKVGDKSYTINITFVPVLDRTLIYDDKNNSSFNVPAGNEMAFTFPPHVFIGDTLTRITNPDYTFTCDATIGTLFWHEKYNELGINTSGITNTVTGKIYATSKADPTKTFSCTVTVGSQTKPSRDPSTYPFKLYDAAEGGNLLKVNSSGQYVVNITPGTPTVVYARVVDAAASFTEGTNYSIIENNTTIATSELVSDDKILKITFPGNIDFQTMGIGCPLTVGETTRSLDIHLVSASYYPFALYDSAEGGNEIPKNSDGWYSVNVTAGRDTVVYARPNNNSVFDDGTEFEITTFGDEKIAALGVLSDDKKLLTITIHGTEALTMDGCGRPLTVDGVKSPLNISFVSTEINIEDLVIPTPGEAHKLKDEEKWPGTTAYEDMGPARFTYKGKSYLVGVGGDNPSFYSSGTKDWDEVESKGYHVGYWQTDEQGNYHQVTDSTLVSELNGAFNGTRTLALYAAEYKGSYPEFYPYSEVETKGMSYTFNNKNSGQWILVLNGTVTDTQVGAQQVTSLVSYIIEYKPTTVYTANTVDEINAYLARLSTVEELANYTIQLAPMDFYGTITLETLAERLPITFQGTTSEDGEHHTVLHGGINVNSGRIYLKNLELAGCGKGKSVWGTNEYGIDPETPNYGLYGTANSSYDDCTFQDYYIAVSCVHGLRWGGGNTTFLNNHIGLFLDRDEADGGSTQMDRFLYKNNDVAIFFKNMPTSTVLPMSAYLIKRTKFIGNGKDIVNLTRKWFFLPGNYFVKDVGPVFSAKDPFGPMTLAEEEITYVSAFPYATNENFDNFVYDAKAVVSNSLAKDWLIPEKDLSGSSITVIDDTSNETAAVWSFGT